MPSRALRLCLRRLATLTAAQGRTWVEWRLAPRVPSQSGYRFRTPEASRLSARRALAANGGRAPPLRCTSLLRSVVLFDLAPRAAVVAVKRRAFFVAGALVRAVAKRLVFGKAAG